VVGTVIKRTGARLRLQHPGGSCWAELKDVTAVHKVQGGEKEAESARLKAFEEVKQADAAKDADKAKAKGEAAAEKAKLKAEETSALERAQQVGREKARAAYAARVAAQRKGQAPMKLSGLSPSSLGGGGGGGGE